VFWVGFDGWWNGSVQQAGTMADCGSNPSVPPSYFAWWETYPHNYIEYMPLTIGPGDDIRDIVEYDESTEDFVMSVRDLTTHEHFTETTPCPEIDSCERDSAEWIVERPAVGKGLAPLADWDQLSLSPDKAAATDRGNKPVYKPVKDFFNFPVEMAGASGDELATVGPLAHGHAFIDTWHASE
jgi:hypothetical protein